MEPFSRPAESEQGKSREVCRVFLCGGKVRERGVELGFGAEESSARLHGYMQGEGVGGGGGRQRDTHADRGVFRACVRALVCVCVCMRWGGGGRV